MARANPNLFEEAVEAGRKIRKEHRFGKNPKVEAMMVAGDLQGVLDFLTPNQRKFVEGIVSGMTQADACRFAGSKAVGDNLKRYGNEMYANPKIRYCIDGLRKQRAESFSVHDDYILRKIISVIDKIEASEKYDAQSILRAAELLGRANGIFRDRQEISGPGGGPIETKDVEDNANAFDTLMDRLKERADQEK